MATQCFPFDNESAENLDRCVGSDILAEYLRFMVGIDHGVYNREGQSFAVSSADGYAVKVQPGICFIQGRGRFDDEETTVTLEASEGLARIDRIVLRLNKPDRWIYLVAVKGTSASNPTAPALVRTDDIYDIGLATVRINPSYSYILPENVTDTRPHTDVCGFLPQFGEFDTTGLFNQIQAAYNQYMALLEQGLDETVAGNLQNQINALEAVAIIPAQCAYTAPTFALTAPDLPATGSCTLRFVAPAAYVKSDTLTVNGESYVLTMVNGKELPDNAWVSGAVVTLQVDTAGKKAFFSGGGADLSFITAGAEQIMSGFVGADVEGEPVTGTRVSEVLKVDVNTENTKIVKIGDTSGTNFYYIVSLVLPIKKFDLIICNGLLDAVRQSDQFHDRHDFTGIYDISGERLLAYAETQEPRDIKYNNNTGEFYAKIWAFNGRTSNDTDSAKNFSASGHVLGVKYK